MSFQLDQNCETLSARNYFDFFWVEFVVLVLVFIYCRNSYIYLITNSSVHCITGNM